MFTEHYWTSLLWVYQKYGEETPAWGNCLRKSPFDVWALIIYSERPYLDFILKLKQAFADTVYLVIVYMPIYRNT